MDSVIITSVITLGTLGSAAGIILYFVAEKFKVYEDPRIDEVEEKLPGANCGGCGYASCRQFAEAVVKTGDLNNLYCPVGGNETMQEIAGVLGLEAKEQTPKVAVVRCNGSYENAPPKLDYEGPESCLFAHSLFAGDSGCPYGCLRQGDCVEACDFDAMYMDENTGLPVVIEDKCTGCNACVEACPRDIIELRPKGKKNRRTYIACMNQEKTGPAKQNCSVPCIGCGLCVKVCPVDAISMDNNLAYIDPDICVNCRKCEQVCPTKSIIEANFPPRKKKPAKSKKSDKKDTSEKKSDAGDTSQTKTKSKPADKGRENKATDTDIGKSNQSSNTEKKSASENETQEKSARSKEKQQTESDSGEDADKGKDTPSESKQDNSSKDDLLKSSGESQENNTDK